MPITFFLTVPAYPGIWSSSADGELAALLQIPSLNLRDHFAAEKREDRGRKGREKEKKERGETVGEKTSPEINFW